MKDTFKDWPLWTTTTSSCEYHSERTDDGYLLELPVPGLSKENLSVKIVNGKLKVKGEKEDHRWTPSFDMTFDLPKDADTKKVEASVENGVLIVKTGFVKDSETVVKII
jgi:HSP20 family protein